MAGASAGHAHDHLRHRIRLSFVCISRFTDRKFCLKNATNVLVAEHGMEFQQRVAYLRGRRQEIAVRQECFRCFDSGPLAGAVWCCLVIFHAGCECNSRLW